MNYLKILLINGFICGLISSIVSFAVFYNNIDTLGQDNEWKFFASLAGFCVFFLMFLALVIVVLARREKQTHNLK